MNLFIFLVMELPPKKKTQKKTTETLHHALRAMMQFPVIFFPG
jgi:hypothetical protein